MSPVIILSLSYERYVMSLSLLCMHAFSIGTWHAIRSVVFPPIRDLFFSQVAGMQFGQCCERQLYCQFVVLFFHFI